MINFSSLSDPFTRLGIGNVKMTTDSQFDDRSHLQFYMDLPDGKDMHTNESTGTMDMVKRDRFELLSAYLDGEVTAAERRQVEEWLADDPTVLCLYKRLLKLRQGMRTLPMPLPRQPVAQTVENVLTSSRRRSKITWMYGSAAVAACVISAVSSLIQNGESRVPNLAQKQSAQPIQQAQSSPSAPVWASPLMVAINNPVVPIPKTAKVSPVVSPENKENKVELQPQPQEIN